jgi:hypothetical protein
MKSMFFAVAGLLALTAAAEAQSLQQQMSKCLAMTGTLQRLACYDAVARGAGIAAAPVVRPAAPATAYAPGPAYAPAPYAAPVQQAYIPPAPTGLGAERLPDSPTSQRKPAKLVADIVRFDLDLRGKFTLTLSNGQVWKQIEGDTDLTKPRKSARTVTIEKAIFGSYSLTFNDSQHLYKVTRLQ